MYKIITLQLLLLSTILFCFYEITRAGTEEMMSSTLGTNAKYDFTMVYQYPIMHRDGTVVQLKLIKFNKEVCTEIEGERGCVSAFTQTDSNYTRRQDQEHPVDTTETLNITFIPGKIPKIREEDLMHELIHVSDYHYMSRDVCETNWRYSSCLENKAYDYTYMWKQIKELQKQKRIKII